MRCAGAILLLTFASGRTDLHHHGYPLICKPPASKRPRVERYASVPIAPAGSLVASVYIGKLLLGISNVRLFTSTWGLLVLAATVYDDVSSYVLRSYNDVRGVVLVVLKVLSLGLLMQLKRSNESNTMSLWFDSTRKLEAEKKN